MEWILSSTTKPETDKEVLVTDGAHLWVMQRIVMGDGFMWTDYERPFLYEEDITHWMPLPSLPPSSVPSVTSVLKTALAE